MGNNENIKILGFVGSLRKGSYNKMLMQAFKENLPANATLEVVNIENLPLYNQDMEDNFPREAMDLKQKIESADAIIIATPEYNRSTSGVLKNAIDWTSRPYGTTTWKGKKILIVGASMGNVGTALAQYNLKQIFSYLDANVLGQPEFYISMAQNKFNEKGNLIDESTKEHIVKAIEVLLK